MNDVRSIIELLEEAVTIHDREGRLRYMNAAAQRPFNGRPLEELLGQRPWDLVPPGPPTPFRLALEGVLAGGPRTRVESHIAAFDRWYEVDVAPHPEGALVVARDITARRQRETELRQSEARFRDMVEHAPEAIVIFNVDERRIEDVNSAAEKLFGRPREVLITLGPEGVSPAHQPDGTSSAEGARRIVEEIVRTDGAAFEWTLLGAGGKTFLAEVRAQMLPSRAPVLLRASIFDITARQRERERREAAERLEAVGRLAAGIAHDFNNLLTVIVGGAQLALLAVDRSSATHEDLSSIVAAGERAALITRQLLTLAKKQPPSSGLLDVETQLARLTPLLERMVGEDVEIDLDVARPLAPIRVAAGQLEQVVLNLVANARDAMPSGGRVEIRACEVSGAGDVPAGQYVRIAVADTGTGIPESVRAHIFEPFVTTKQLHRGTGLGLATVHGIVEGAGGHIRVASDGKIGTTFNVYFPCGKGEALVTSPEEAAGHDEVGGTETILLVDDDDEVRRFVRRALERGGYRVIDAKNAGEALLLFETVEPPIDLVVTDLVMPRVTGDQLSKRLRVVRPDLRVLFLSGYAEKYPTPSSGRDAFLAKPVTVQALLKGVRALLAS